MWLLWAAIGYFLNATAIAVDKILLTSKQIKNPAVYTVMISILGLFVLVLTPFGLEFVSIPVLLVGLVSGAIFTVGLWLMFTILKTAEASRVPALIGSWSPLFVLILAFISLGERLSIYEIASFVLLVLGGLLITQGKSGLKGYNLVLAIGAAIAFAVSSVLLKFSLEHTNFVSSLIWNRLGASGAGLFLLLLPGVIKELRNDLSVGHKSFKWIVLGGQTAGALSGLIITYAISLTSVSLVNALQGVQYVFLLVMAAILSRFHPSLLKEEFSRAVLFQKIQAMILIGAGLWLLSLG